MKKICSLITILIAITAWFPAGAQTLSNEDLKAQLIKDWERAKKYTDAYLDAMPADRYAKKVVDSIRTFSEQMLHLASGNIGLVANGTGAQRIFAGFNMEKSAGAQSKDSVTHYVNASYDYAINSIRNMDAAQLGEHVKRGNLDETKLSWIQKAFEHQTHHRGQCTIYIRLQGVKPPNEMLF
ncbi:DinB family protein [Sediminibacterium soli]|uniref:DinB family protein n=1 Tax=Sediminibacterium soli TaxID=2698829 RepID=UPI00137AC554|nr:DinB family protein [Sediminibacterium soli]NCI47615.1 DinB family protein [Sediminibacterium soli]